MESIKRRIGLEILICIVLVWNWEFVLHKESSIFILSWPMELIGTLLIKLSIYSSWGNLIAWLVVFGLTGLPIALYFTKKKKGQQNEIDWMLILLSAYTLYLLLINTNPNFLRNLHHLEPSDLESIQALYLGKMMIYYGLWIGYGMIVLVESIRKDILNIGEKIKENLNRLLSLVIYFNVGFAVFFIGFENIHSIDGFNIGLIFQLVISYVLKVTPIIFTIKIALDAKKLVCVLWDESGYDIQIEKAKRMLNTSVKTIYITVLAGFFENSIQYWWNFKILPANISLTVQFIPIGMAFISAILAKVFYETQVLKKENEMII